MGAAFFAHSAEPVQRRDVRTALWIATALSTVLIAGFAQFSLTQAHGMSGDALYAYTFAKNYINGHGPRINPNLGFPGVMDAAYFPSFDFSQRLILRIASWFTDQSVVSYNLMYVVGVIAMTLCSLVAFQAIGIPLSLSMIGTAIYVLSPYFVFRSFGHDFLALYYSAPLGAAVCLVVAKHRLSDFVRSPFTWAASIVVATSGLYYAFFSSMFISLVAVAVAGARRSFEPLIMAALSLSIIVPVLFLTGFGSAIPDVLAGRIPQVHRLPYEQLILGLSTAEAVHVLRDLPLVGWTFNYYLSVMPGLLHVHATKGLFEWPGPVLSAVIILSPVIALVSGLSRVHRTNRQELLFICAVCLCFGLIYAERGGLAFYFNLLVTPQIRATARIIPFLSFFAITLVLIAADALLKGRSSAKMAGLAIVLVLVVAALPNVDAFGKKADGLARDKATMDHIASVRALLVSKDRAGLTTILQLPAVSWSEIGPTRNFSGYSHQVPFVLDKAESSTRWSYGAAPAQSAYSSVAELVDQHKLAGLTEAARSSGFDGVLVEKAAYTSEELKVLSGALSGACLLYDDPDRSLVDLRTHPSGCDQKNVNFAVGPAR